MKAADTKEVQPTGQIKNYRDLIVWQKAMKLVTDIYLITQDFPQTEDYGLTIQIRRSAVSIPSNIAEGTARNSRKDYIRFLHVALGSLFELQTQLEISENLSFQETNQFELLNESGREIERMLCSLIRNLKK